jgi:hypothetical protein
VLQRHTGAHSDSGKPAVVCNIYFKLGKNGLFIKSKNSRVIRIGIAILLVLLGCLIAFAQRRGRGRRNPDFFFPELMQRPVIEHPTEPSDAEFVFARMVYTGIRPYGYPSNWYTDAPKADRQFILGIQRLTNIRVAQEAINIELTDPDLFQYPFLYSVECGQWNFTDAEALGLREYLRRGGFLFCDDFWGTREWENFRYNILQVLPEAQIRDIPMDHAVFHCYYDIDELVQTPYYESAINNWPTYEQDGYYPYCRGIFDENERLMVIINWNTDLGDSWEWLDHPDFPAKYSTYAYKIGINAIVYAMSH